MCTGYVCDISTKLEILCRRLQVDQVRALVRMYSIRTRHLCLGRKVVNDAIDHADEVLEHIQEWNEVMGLLVTIITSEREFKHML